MNYNVNNDLAGVVFRLCGVSLTLYGVISSDIENVLGGFALTYFGSSMVGQYGEAVRGETQIKKLDQILSQLEKITEKNKMPK